jgi:uncharacterized protein (TIGR03083 family)
MGKLSQMDTLEQLQAAQAYYLESVAALGEHSWHRPTLCEGWDAADVVAHVAGGDRVTRAVALEATGRDPELVSTLGEEMRDASRWAEALPVRDPALLADAARTASAEAVEALSEALALPPSTLLRMPYGQVPPVNVALVRMAEYIIHGHDLHPASGHPRPAPPWYVEATLPRAIQMMPRTHARSPHKGKTASYHFHRLDGAGEWTLWFKDGEARTEPGHDRAEVAFRGSAESLYWLLMGRGNPEELGIEVMGDPQLAAAFKEWLPGP